MPPADAATPPADAATPPTEEGIKTAPETTPIELDPAELGGGEFKAGDVIQLKVVGHTAQGKLQCERVESEEDGGWEKGFDEHMSEQPEQPQSAPAGEEGEM